jgi:hypothetical protein
MNQRFTILNLYGLYAGREALWSRLFGLQYLRFYDLIIGGDLNFTISKEEVLGSVAREDKLALFFRDQIECHGLIEIEPILIRPTWINNKKGEDGISKFIVLFLASLDLLDNVKLYRI